MWENKLSQMKKWRWQSGIYLLSILALFFLLTGCQAQLEDVNHALEATNAGLSHLTGDPEAMPSENTSSHSAEFSSASDQHVSSESGMAQQSRTSTKKSKPIKNPYAKLVTATQAMNWLKHNNRLWNDGGRISSKMNWFQFWSDEVGNRTTLAKAAYHYCNFTMQNQNKNTGDNCQTYWQAYSSENSLEEFSNEKFD